jgi:hypothetical protein
MIMNKVRHIRFFQMLIAAIASIFAAGCSAFFYTPLSITAYSPSLAVMAPAERPAVWVEFSAPVDHAQGEQAFSLSQDNDPMGGRFSWTGQRLAFTPYEDFGTAHAYVLKVATTVEDGLGNSLEREFIFRFRFGTDTIRPTVIDAWPATPAVDCDPFDHETLGAVLPDDRYHPVTIAFSEPVDPASLYTAFSIAPGVTGRFSWTTDATAVFTPAEPYDWQTEYLVTIGTTLKDREGNTLAEEFRSHFFVGTDRTPPAVVSVTSVVPVPARQGTQPETPVELIEYNLVGGWEADWEIEVRFNEPVTEESVTAAFTFTPAWDCLVRFDPLVPDRVLLKRALSSTRFRYGQAYSLQIREGIEDRQGNKSTRPGLYHFNVNGAYTRPPEISNVYYLEDSAQNLAPGWSGEWDWMLLHPLDTLTIPNDGGGSPPRTGVLDFYFTCAERITLPCPAFAENFRITFENGCIAVPVLTALQVITPANAASALPPLPPDVTLGPNEIVMRVFVRFVNNSNGGSITLALGQDCADQSLDNQALHNPLAADWSLRLRDPD